MVTRKVFAGNPRESTVQRHRQTIKCPREAPEPNPRPGAHKTSISEHSICNLGYPSGPDLARRTKEKSAPGRPLIVNTGRDDWIRTSDPLLPKQEASVRLRLPSVCAYVPEWASSKEVTRWMLVKATQLFCGFLMYIGELDVFGCWCYPRRQA